MLKLFLEKVYCVKFPENYHPDLELEFLSEKIILSSEGFSLVRDLTCLKACFVNFSAKERRHPRNSEKKEKYLRTQKITQQKEINTKFLGCGTCERDKNVTKPQNSKMLEDKWARIASGFHSQLF